MQVISRISSGGQSGVDRGALDAARGLGIPICGWVPKGGWAEDATTPPGVLAQYPELKETPTGDVKQRTEWNARDARATLVLVAWPLAISPGTNFTAESARKYGRPYKEIADLSRDTAGETLAWLAALGRGLTLNIGGPRESEAPGAYAQAYKFVRALLLLQQSA